MCVDFKANKKGKGGVYLVNNCEKIPKFIYMYDRDASNGILLTLVIYKVYIYHGSQLYCGVWGVLELVR